MKPLFTARARFLTTLAAGAAIGVIAVGTATAARAAGHPASGPLLAWGSNQEGQLGDGTELESR